MATKDLLQGVEVVLLDIGKIPGHEPLPLPRGEVRPNKMSGESSPRTGLEKNAR